MNDGSEVYQRSTAGHRGRHFAGDFGGESERCIGN
nr:MAG TPA: hypothetical protein [Caudoviricetes sp.]